MKSFSLTNKFFNFAKKGAILGLSELIILGGIYFNIVKADTEKKLGNLQRYKTNYIAKEIKNGFNGKKEDAVEYQVSIMNDISYVFGGNFCLGYTQKGFDYVWEESSPIKEIDHNFDFFWKTDISSKKYNVDYFKIGFWNHKSNGGPRGASMDYDGGYVELGLIQRFKDIEIGANTKLFALYRASVHQKNIQDYIGSFEEEFFLKTKFMPIFDIIRFSNRVGAGGGILGYDLKKGWSEHELELGLNTEQFIPNIFLKYRRGTNYTMMNYNKKEKHLLMGLAFGF